MEVPHSLSHFVTFRFPKHVDHLYSVYSLRLDEKLVNVRHILSFRSRHFSLYAGRIGLWLDRSQTELIASCTGSLLLQQQQTESRARPTTAMTKDGTRPSLENLDFACRWETTTLSWLYSFVDGCLAIAAVTRRSRNHASETTRKRSTMSENNIHKRTCCYPTTGENEHEVTLLTVQVYLQHMSRSWC